MVIKPNRSGGAKYASGYTDIADHGLIGNMRTAALVSVSGTVSSLCWPHFDSPSVFARILDKDKGGHWSIATTTETQSKQMYCPSTNILATKFLSEEGVGQIEDFMPLPNPNGNSPSFLPWLVRRVEVIRGTMTYHMEVAPAFNYAMSSHETSIEDNSSPGALEGQKAVFTCQEHMNLDFRYVTKDGVVGGRPSLNLDYLDLSERGHKGLGVTADFTLKEGQSITFVLREIPAPRTSGEADGPRQTQGESTAQPGLMGKKGASAANSTEDPPLTQAFCDALFRDTQAYWLKWLSRCTYTGRWREFVQRSALALKLLTFSPTGAIVAAPTFSLPEDLHGAGRNWDYRYSWLRDSSFTVYALLRLGFTEEADQYVEWLSGLMRDRNPDGGLQIVYTIHGRREMPERELPHLDGHKGQKPVHIGNGAVDHLQLDIYGELLDGIYLAQKFSKPLSYDNWIGVRDLVDYVVWAWNQPDLSIWEVRNMKRNFLYSKIMCWVALDRGIRLADKRSLPCPNRMTWLLTRDKIYEEIQQKGWNAEKGFFSQSYENKDVLDSAVLIMPLTFFMNATDPRFLSTLMAILRTPEQGGLTENNLVYRYDIEKVSDGVGGQEGAFSMCTLWAVEALTRAGTYDPIHLGRAVNMLEDFMGYSNHLGLFSEEISKGGEALGNFPQGFSHVATISTCFNLDRATRSKNGSG